LTLASVTSGRLPELGETVGVAPDGNEAAGLDGVARPDGVALAAATISGRDTALGPPSFLGSVPRRRGPPPASHPIGGSGRVRTVEIRIVTGSSGWRRAVAANRRNATHP
jgi:hypothetical protein